MRRVVIGGGGIAGLATAAHLRDLVTPDTEILVLEAGPRLGGNIQTERQDGFIVERGPNGYLDNAPATAALVARIGLDEEVLPADARAARRFIFRDGRLHEIPLSPLRFFGSPVLSARGRARILLEPFARRRPAGVDESVAAFATRRIGGEAARVLVDAMVSGVFAGDVDRLSLASAFPKMAKMEADHGSLVRAMIAAGKTRRREGRRAPRSGGPSGPGGTLTSFRAGLDTFVSRLAEHLSSVRVRVRVECPIRTVSPVPGNPGRWVVETPTDLVEADAVVLATPAPHTAPILERVDPRFGQELRAIPAASLAVVALAYDATSIGADLDGFGFLVPRGQGPRILGCLWDSSLFPGRAPDGRVLLRAMIGGAHDPVAVELGDDALLEAVRKDLATAMGVTSRPSRTWIFRHRLGIAQYDIGHGARLERLRELLEANPGVWLAGSSYHGIAMNACIEKSREQAAAVAAYLAQRRGAGASPSAPRSTASVSA